MTSTSAPLICASSIACTSSADVADLVGWGSSVVFADTGRAAHDELDIHRAIGVRSEHGEQRRRLHRRRADTELTGTPTGPTDPVDATIAEIQGTAASSPLAGTTVRTTGVVTAAYPTGGINGYVIQTAGTGGATDATPGASDAIFVFSSSTAGMVAIGDTVQVTGAGERVQRADRDHGAPPRPVW